MMKIQVIMLFMMNCKSHLFKEHSEVQEDAKPKKLQFKLVQLAWFNFEKCRNTAT